MKDFSLYPLLLPQLASDTLQNVSFCSGERGLQGHTLLAADTPSPPQEYRPSESPPTLSRPSCRLKRCVLPVKIAFSWSPSFVPKKASTRTLLVPVIWAPFFNKNTAHVGYLSYKFYRLFLSLHSLIVTTVTLGSRRFLFCCE